MGQKLLIGLSDRGLRNDVTPFNIDNNSFPVLTNAYQWRKRILRKRGTSFLSRLKRYFDSTSTSYNSGSTTITLNGSGVGNILTGFSLETNANIVPGTVTIFDTISMISYTDPDQDGTLSPSGSINYSTGAITNLAAANNAVTVEFSYYPGLPVMGLEDLILQVNQFPGNLEFDTKYSYNLNTASPYSSYNVSFYKNPPSASINGIAYTQKTVVTPTTWNSQNYQQVWTINYQGALWATNGITEPFSATNIGMQFQIPNVGGITWIDGQHMSFNIDNCPLVIGDWVFVNEFIEGIPPPGNEVFLNQQTGFVTNVVIVGITSTVTVAFPYADIPNDTYTGGMIQYLTNRSDTTKDCLRWYDGDPTNGSSSTPVLNGDKGWVNFAPPLSILDFSIADLPAAQYYLVGARMIVPFKDRLVFFGAVIQTSSGSPIYLQDTIIYSQNGTPYYTASFEDDPSLATTIFFQLLVPTDQTAAPNAYWEDQTGFGGFTSVGVDQPFQTVGINQDVLIVGLSRLQTRMVYSGNDIVPFNFFIINSEYGSGSTFSTVVMDKGVMTKGSRGFVITSQDGTQRFDLEIPDEVFEVRLTDNGTERVTAQRDFIKEWIYFTYPVNELNEDSYIYPTQTLQYNYRDNSWALFTETYTTYGLFRKRTGFTWATVGEVYPTWAEWNDPWNAGVSTLLQPEVICGNQQGFVLSRTDGTGEGFSLSIQGFSGNTVTCPDHCLRNGDFIIIDECIGTVSSQVNGKIFSVMNPDQNTFELNPPIDAGTYLGLGLIKRMYVPFVQTKQFPIGWDMARKTRIGVQQYLLTTTQAGKIQLLVFLSQNNDSAYNTGPIVPSALTTNNSLIYSTVLYTCPEAENLGLTPANINLQIPTSQQQRQTWHRMNTSLIGDTVQIGFTMSEEQMREISDNTETFAITGITQASPCVVTTTANFSIGTMIKITGVEGMVQINFDPGDVNGTIYQVIDTSSSSVTIDLDSTGFDVYTSGGLTNSLGMPNQFEEIELHAMILDVSPSQVLV